MLSSDNDVRVLVLYAGGTIGMLKSDSGFRPAKGYMFEFLRSDRRFHDPQRESLASHSHSEKAYKEWLTSPSPSQSGSSTPNTPLDVDTLRVQTSAGPLALPCLTSPRNDVGKRLRFVVWQYDQLIDSSEIELEDWRKMASDIGRNYTAFDAFLILHGTDTMAYTAAALSFMLEGLGKTVIITGAQIPISSNRNDGIDNLLGALTIARDYIIPEVTLYFNNNLFRGNRTTKVSTTDFAAFASPNLPPLGTVGIAMDFAWDEVLTPTPNKPFQPHTSLSSNIRILQLWPGITSDVIQVLTASPVQGLILKTYGSGNAPQRKDFLDCLTQASQRGVVIVNITQCQKGSVLAAYESGQALSKAGVISGLDMTVEAAFAKLSYLIGRGDLDAQTIRIIMQRPLRGELTPPIVEPQISLSEGRQRLHAMLVDLDAQDRHKAGATEVSTSRRLTDQEYNILHKTLLPILLSQMSAEADSEALKRFLENNKPVPLEILNSTEDSVTLPPLLAAIRHRRKGNVELLLTAGASVHLKDPMSGHSALYIAQDLEEKEIVTALVNAGAHLQEQEK